MAARTEVKVSLCPQGQQQRASPTEMGNAVLLGNETSVVTKTHDVLQEARLLLVSLNFWVKKCTGKT